jgi:hypothetical protein
MNENIDVVQRGIESKGIPFDSGRAQPSPAESEPIDGVDRGVPDAIRGSSDDELIKESVNALNEKRRKEWESGVGGTDPDPFASQRNLVDVELKYDSRDDRTKTLREATKDVSDRHLLDRPEAQLARAQFGFSDDEILKLTKDENWLQSLGYTPQQAAIYARTGEPPPMKVVAAREDGSLIRPLDDDAPVGIKDAFLNRSELKRGMRNFRAAEAAAQEQLRAALSAPDPAVEQTAAAVEQAPQIRPAVSEPAQPTPQQSDPLAAERSALMQERNSYLQASQGSAAEEQAAHQIKVWNAALLRQFPEASNQAAIAELARTNPARAQQLAAAAKKTSDAVAGWMQRGQAATAHREAGERGLAALQQAHERAAWHQYKEQQDNLFHKHAPELSDPVKAATMRAGVKTMLNELGFGNDELAAAWDGRTGFSVRDSRAQRLIRDAFLWRQAQSRANQVTRAPLPPVQKPGTIQVRGSGDVETIRRLQQELEGATGDRAVRLATSLHRARRSAGM